MDITQFKPLLGGLGVRFDVPVHAGPKAHPAFFKMGIGSVS